jgi:Na+/H+ antiporter NhaD/arsenite permease-like protein
LYFLINLQGFKIITDAIRTRSKTALLWILGFLTFFMSAILDNLTSTIVMVSLIRKLVKVRVILFVAPSAPFTYG